MNGEVWLVLFNCERPLVSAVRACVSEEYFYRGRGSLGNSKLEESLWVKVFRFGKKDAWVEGKASLLFWKPS